MKWYEVAANVIYYITIPIVKLVFLLLYIVRWILSPFIFLLQAIWQLILIPVNIAAKFEAIWYFIGGAVIVGLFAAFLNYGILQTFVLVFRLDRPPVKDTPARGHTAKTYRKAREKRRKIEIERSQDVAEAPLLEEALRKMSRPKTSLLDDTIVEHSSEGSAGL